MDMLIHPCTVSADKEECIVMGFNACEVQVSTALLSLLDSNLLLVGVACFLLQDFLRHIFGRLCHTV